MPKMDEAVQFAGYLNRVLGFFDFEGSPPEFPSADPSNLDIVLSEAVSAVSTIGFDWDDPPGVVRLRDIIQCGESVSPRNFVINNLSTAPLYSIDLNRSEYVFDYPYYSDDLDSYIDDDPNAYSYYTTASIKPPEGSRRLALNPGVCSTAPFYEFPFKDGYNFPTSHFFYIVSPISASDAILNGVQYKRLFFSLKGIIPSNAVAGFVRLFVGALVDDVIEDPYYHPILKCGGYLYQIFMGGTFPGVIYSQTPLNSLSNVESLQLLYSRTVFASDEIDSFCVYAPKNTPYDETISNWKLFVYRPMWIGSDNGNIISLSSVNITSSGVVNLPSNFDVVVYQVYSLLDQKPDLPYPYLDGGTNHLLDDPRLWVNKHQSEAFVAYTLLDNSNQVYAYNINESVARIKLLFGIKRKSSTRKWELIEEGKIFDKGRLIDTTLSEVVVSSESCYSIQKKSPSSWWLFGSSQLMRVFGIPIPPIMFFLDSKGDPRYVSTALNAPYAFNPDLVISLKSPYRLVPGHNIDYSGCVHPPYPISSGLLFDLSWLDRPFAVITPIVSDAPSEVSVSNYLTYSHGVLIPESHKWVLYTRYFGAYSRKSNSTFETRLVKPLTVFPDLESYLRYPYVVISESVKAGDILENDKSYISEAAEIIDSLWMESGVPLKTPCLYRAYNERERLVFKKEEMVVNESDVLPGKQWVDIFEIPVNPKPYPRFLKFALVFDGPDYLDLTGCFSTLSGWYSVGPIIVDSVFDPVSNQSVPVMYGDVWVLSLRDKISIPNLLTFPLSEQLNYGGVAGYERFFMAHVRSGSGLPADEPPPYKGPLICRALIYPDTDRCIVGIWHAMYRYAEYFWSNPYYRDKILNVYGKPYELHTLGEESFESVFYTINSKVLSGVESIVPVSDGLVYKNKILPNSYRSYFRASVPTASITISLGPQSSQDTLYKLYSNKVVVPSRPAASVVSRLLPWREVSWRGYIRVYTNGYQIPASQSVFPDIGASSRRVVTPTLKAFVETAPSTKGLIGAIVSVKDTLLCEPIGDFSKGFRKLLSGNILWWDLRGYGGNWGYSGPELLYLKGSTSYTADPQRLPVLVPQRDTQRLKEFRFSIPVTGSSVVYPYVSSLYKKASVINELDIEESFGSNFSVDAWVYDLSDQYVFLQESAGIFDTYYELSVVLSESSYILDSFDDNLLLSERVEISTTEWFLVMSEEDYTYGLVSDILSSIRKSFPIQSESLTAVDLIRDLRIFYQIIQEVLTCSEAFLIVLGLIIKEGCYSSDKTKSPGDFSWNYYDLIRGAVATTPSVARLLELSESGDLGDSFQILRTLLNILSELASGRDISTVSSRAQVVLSVESVIRELIKFGYKHEISEQATITLSSPLSYIVNLIIANTVSFEDVFKSDLGWVYSDRGEGFDQVSNYLEIHFVVEDMGRILPRLYLDNETYDCWCFSMDMFKASIFTNYNFDSFTSVGSQTFATKNDGVYLLEGDIDNSKEIPTGVRVDLGSLGSHLKKRFYRAYFGVSSSGTPRLKAIADDHEVVYDIIEGRANIAVGQQGRRWIFELTEVDSMDFIELVPIILSR